MNDFVLSFGWLLLIYLIKFAEIFLSEKKQSKSIKELLKNIDSLDELRDIWFYNQTDEFIKAIIDHRKYLFPSYSSAHEGYNIDDIDTLSLKHKSLLCAVMFQDMTFFFLS